jgi:hypothetical protein
MMGSDDFEDDGASFRVRRLRQLAGMQPRRGELYTPQGVLIRWPAPSIVRYVYRAWAVSFLAFLAVLAFCVVDFALWCLGLPV